MIILKPNNITLSGVFLCNKSGNICSCNFRPSWPFPSQPYMKIFDFLECACKSQNITTCRSSISLGIHNQKAIFYTVYTILTPKIIFYIWNQYLRSISFVCQITGWASRMTLRYCRFKSRPFNEHLLLPTITPSGFNIGISLKIKRFLNS